jgi:hypothetical protein
VERPLREEEVKPQAALLARDASVMLRCNIYRTLSRFTRSMLHGRYALMSICAFNATVDLPDLLFRHFA